MVLPRKHAKYWFYSFLPKMLRSFISRHEYLKSCHTMSLYTKAAKCYMDQVLVNLTYFVNFPMLVPVVFTRTNGLMFLQLFLNQ